MINFALIGYGRFGKNYERAIIFNNLGNISWYCAKSEKNFQNFSDNYKVVCAKPDVDVVIIATPPSTHYEICKFALENNKNVICEKPFVFRSEEAAELKDLAEKKGLFLFIDYIHIFNNKIKELKELIDLAKIKDRVFVSFESCAYGPDRKDCSILWDWYSHDLSILFYIFGYGFKFQSYNEILFDSLNNRGVVFSSCSNELVLSNSYINNNNVHKCRKISITSGENKFSFVDSFDGKSLFNMLEYYTKKINSGSACSNAGMALEITRHIEEIEKHELAIRKLDLKRDAFSETKFL